MNSFDPLSPVKDEESFLEGFKLHMWLAFREFDINFYETYVFTVVVGLTLLWAVSSIL